MTDDRTTGEEAGRPGVALPAMEVAARSARLRTAIDGVCELFIVTKPANVRWLTGFTGSNAAVAVTADELVVATDARYTEQLDQQLDEAGVEARIVIERAVLAALLEGVPADLAVGLEHHHVTWAQHQQAVEVLGPDRVRPLDRLVETEREVKDEGELARLSRAATIADEALASVLADLPPQVTEQQIARRLETTMVDLGADGISFPTIVAAGVNSSRPHAVPSARPLADGDLLVIDMGAAVDGYGSDMTRTFVVGGFSAETEDMYRAVETAQAAGVAAVVDGVSTVAVDGACRGVLGELGMADEFVHGAGHGIGLEIHETPFLGKTDPVDLRTGQVVTVEPGVYRAGVGGVRIEDSVIVTGDGCRPITLSPKNPELDWRPVGRHRAR